MAFRFVLLALPALALARIDIELSGKFDPQNPNLQVYFSGNDVAVVSDDERSTFKIGDSNLKDSIRAYFGKRPDDAYLRSPTPWGDLYQSYGWPQVTRTLIPRSAKILAISSQPQIVMRQVFENNSTKPATFNVGISQSVQNTVSSSWSKGGDLTIGQEISYGVDIEGIVGGGSTSFSYTSSWGENTEKSQSVTVGASSAMEILLQPGQGVIAELQATRGSIKVEVEYTASLSGSSAVNYGKTYKGHHFWSLDIRAIMSSGGLSNSVVSKEVLDIGFYSNSKVIVHDRSLGTKFMELSF
ncbi:hypothetical protein ABMA28_010695 [Loxostege sticticalis]|uniref:Follicular epithelium yolk protein subunit n=1 Tax=Loxostege sticticalis TaxID=481309 RepID=A0ABD0S961_LOXSC